MPGQAGEINGLHDTASKDLDDLIKALRRYALAMVGNTADADDIVQETLKRALTYFDGTKKIRNLRAYLFTMLRNVHFDMVKKQIRAGDPVEMDQDIPLAVLPDQNDRLVCREVADAIKRLPDEQREVLLLVGLEGITYDGVAEILDLPIGTVMSRLNRGRRALRRDLDMPAGIETESRLLTWRVGRPIVEASLATSVLVPAA